MLKSFPLNFDNRIALICRVLASLPYQNATL